MQASNTQYKIQVVKCGKRIEVTEVEHAETRGYDSRSSFLVKGSTSTLEGCGATKANQRHKGLTLFSGEQRHEGLAHAPLSGCLKVATVTFTQRLGHTSTTQLEAPNNRPRSFYNTKQAPRATSHKARVSQHGNSNKQVGYSNPFGGSVDLGFLP